MPVVYIFFKFLERLNQPFSKSSFCFFLLIWLFLLLWLFLRLWLFLKFWFTLIFWFSFNLLTGCHLISVSLPPVPSSFLFFCLFFFENNYF